MSDFSWIPPTVASVSAAVIAVLGFMRSARNGREIAVVKADTAKVVEHTNGTLSAANAAVTAATNAKDVLLERVEGLEKALTALRESGALAASTAVQAATDVRSAQAMTPPDTLGESTERSER